jgi:hypothetical protein
LDVGRSIRLRHFDKFRAMAGQVFDVWYYWNEKTPQPNIAEGFRKIAVIK